MEWWLKFELKWKILAVNYENFEKSTHCYDSGTECHCLIWHIEYCEWIVVGIYIAVYLNISLLIFGV